MLETQTATSNWPAGRDEDLQSPFRPRFVRVGSDIHIGIPQVSIESGEESNSRAKDDAGSPGRFTAGCPIGVVFDGEVGYRDQNENKDVAYPNEIASASRAEDDGAAWEIPPPNLIGLQAAQQNTSTGQVALVLHRRGTYAFVTFVPSVVEPREEDAACATPDADDFTRYERLAGRKRVRDWCYRIPGGVKLRLLEGESSVAAAIYAAAPSVKEHDTAGGAAGSLSGTDLCRASSVCTRGASRRRGTCAATRRGGRPRC